MRSIHTNPLHHGSGGPLGHQQQQAGQQAGQQQQQQHAQATVAITSSFYDKRGLLTRDTDALGQSLRALAYLTLANTHVVAALMAADGGLSLLVAKTRDLLCVSDSDDGDDEAEADDSRALASHALAAATNLVVRGRSKVRDALVEAGLVNVLVRFLGPIVAAIEDLQKLSQEAGVSLSQTPQITTTTSTTTTTTTTSSAITTTSIPTAEYLLAPTLPLSSTEPNTPTASSSDQSQPLPLDHQPQHPQNAQRSIAPPQLPHAPPSAEQTPLPVHPLLQEPNPHQQNLQPQLQAPQTTAATLPTQSRTQDVGLLPGLRLPLPSSPLVNALLAKVIPYQQHIMMAIKILHMVSKYPHLRHYMHIDSIRPVRPRIVDLCGAARAAAEAEKAAASANVVEDKSDSMKSGLGISLDVPRQELSTLPPINAADIDQLRRVNFDRFDSGITLPPLNIANSASSTNTQPDPVLYPLETINPTITTIPLLVFENEDPMEIDLLEQITALPTHLPKPSNPAQPPHLIQSTLHYSQAPTNPRSAFELLEVFTSPCSLLPEARTLSVATLRNAYRRDPVPTPSEPPFTPLTQAMGPCMYINPDTPTPTTVAPATSGKRSLVVGLGHLRRCANSRCGAWEQGYKQFSKCSRCRRVSYCSKGCQRRAWVLHKNWCLKYVGDQVTNSAAVVAVAAVPVAAPTAAGAVNGGGVGGTLMDEFPGGQAALLNGFPGVVVPGGDVLGRRGSGVVDQSVVVSGDDVGSPSGVAPSAEEMY
ncbi:hypothetical protein HDU79_010665 [Rhizoclosmatium sp. JEL0117]|nr:hypothetical protein HDU79_010665 [Rhizoclosmatium sp. JEL0117]